MSNVCSPSVNSEEIVIFCVGSMRLLFPKRVSNVCALAVFSLINLNNSRAALRPACTLALLLCFLRSVLLFCLSWV